MRFRPSVRAVAAKHVPLFALLLGAVGLLYWLDDPRWSVVAVLLGAAAALALWRDIIPTWRCWIEVDAERVSGSIRDSDFSLDWNEIAVARLDTEGESPVLDLASADDSVSIELAAFPTDALWRAIRDRVPSRALDPEAYKSLPAYEEWTRHRDDLVAERVEVRDAAWIRVVGWACIAFFLGCSVFASLGDEVWTLLIFVPFTLLGAFVVAQAGTTIVSSEGVSRRSGFGLHHIPWSEVRTLELDPRTGGMVLRAGRRQLALPGPMSWPSSEVQTVMDALLAHVERRGITIDESSMAAFRFSRGTKVRRR